MRLTAASWVDHLSCGLLYKPFYCRKCILS